MENEDNLTQLTQNVVDPRRMGRNNSGLSESDISDVMCILHPCSPAAFAIVANTAAHSPQNVLQNTGFEIYDDGVSDSRLQEEETFILGSDGPNHAMDLALRFSVLPINPGLGFVFGRNAKMCDIVLANDTYKRVSNMHFSIFVNDSAVLMLRDISTNGTMVDDVILKGGKTTNAAQTRMLNPGSIIQILSPKHGEIVKFIVRIPTREGHIEEYHVRFQEYVRRVSIAQERARREHETATQRPHTDRPAASRTQSLKAAMLHNQYGMHWNGGEKYNVVGHIGRGAFATVFQLATKSEGQLFAAKELEKRKFMKNGVLDRKLDNEMQIMKAIAHPNIVQYVDYQDHSNHLYIIMEFVPGGDLQHYLGSQGALAENLGKAMSAQVLEALSYLHAKKITHRDIKPDNILIADMAVDRFTVKLSDFGLSKVVKDNDTFLKTFCGTLLYCAPEVFPHYDAHVASRGQKRARRGNVQQPSKFHSYSQSVDVWSYGAVLWYSMCMKPPFEGVSDATGRGMFEKIMMTPLDSTDLIEKGISDDAVSLLAEMLNTDPSTRPSPAECLSHPWLGMPHLASQSVADDALGAIAEEEEGDAPNVAALNIDDQQGSGDSQYDDEVSIHSGSINLFDPRQSKRFKSDAPAYQDSSQVAESSPLVQQESIPIAHEPFTQPRPPQRKLFGEISQSALNAPGGLGMYYQFENDTSRDTTQNGIPTQAGLPLEGRLPAQNRHADEQQREPENWSQQAHPGTAPEILASPSLLGAESLLRDVHMESPQADNEGQEAEPNEPAPHTPSVPQQIRSGCETDGTPNGHNDITPKPPQQRSHSRQINIPKSASFYWDANDPSTHTLEYASKVSGYDFKSNSDLSGHSSTSMPPTQHGSAVDDDGNHQGDTDVEAEHDGPTLLPAPTEFVKPPPRLGKLVTTPDSFRPITLNLSSRITTWGRAPNNTVVYHESHDTRIPKRGIILYFHAPDIESLPENADWTKLPGLHCVLRTDSSVGIHVNGVLLPRGEPGKMAFGQVYSGDEIGVWRKGNEILKFTCEFFHGQGKERRRENRPRFHVEYERTVEELGTKQAEKENIANGALRQSN